ncbi:cytochrome P450 [Aspergillus heteromorphus CBS 117.55]|uniref:Cytochrome P450 n=1 Tax=Aspergillus heteromorphus CBS 117.55 TaxID=1448321 RepID=A0A317WLG5_9EURO|nr:cytochrome P450 [Aspergillus heteromorphus CBS 117.55]PWY85897.1 cytochrome P450 [Aspergillus heteromorphus CBS 117.55]
MVYTMQMAALAGGLSHIVYFHRGEHHFYGTAYAQAFSALFTAAAAALHAGRETAWMEALATVAQHAASYLVGLFSSLLVYRLLLHPLGRFPGPLLARISSLWLPFHMQNNNRHHRLVELHKKYGPYVRIGSSDLSVIDPKAIDAIQGQCAKSTWYDHSQPSKSLQAIRDAAEHQQRRRVWSTAFGSQQLRGYEQRVRKYRQKLVDRLASKDGHPVNVTKWFNLYTFDVMGDLTFGKGFESLERGEEHWAIRLLIDTMVFAGSGLPIWSFRLVAAIPGLKSGFWKFLEYSEARLVERMKIEPDIPDISASLLAPLKGRAPTVEERQWLGGDSRLIIVARSDTTATTLAGIFYQLARHPDEVRKLRAELAPYVDANEPAGEFLDAKISHLEHLNGVINEGLRLYPGIPSALPRETPPEGIHVDGVYIPGNTTVICPLYVMGRSELSYQKPLEFIPERWYQQPELVRDKSAFAPFTIGAYNCIGKPLALMNLRTTVARLVMSFDVQYAPGFVAESFDQRSRDMFVLYLGALEMIFRPRG